MEKIINFIKWTHKRNDSDSLDCCFDFTIVDSSIIGTPREHTANHRLKVSMSHELLVNWSLETPLGSGISDNMLKVAFQLAEEYIKEQLRKDPLLEDKLPPLSRNTGNSTDSCPYKISNIAYPTQTAFKVILDNNLLSDAEFFNAHPNILVLINRMDDALNRNDFAGVLHSSASIFETMAKDIVGIPTVQNQTLKTFFDRYRKDSNLPKKVLDYIVGIYDLRSTMPLAGHGSTEVPTITREIAISLAEMTKAFIKIEYKLRLKQP